MSDLLRDAPVGQLVRFITKNKVLLYPEEKPGYTCPAGYSGAKDTSSPPESDPRTPDEKWDNPLTPGAHSLASPATLKDVDPFDHANRDSLRAQRTLSKVMTRPDMNKVATRKDLEQQYTAATQQQSFQKQPTQPIVPQKTEDGIILVDWYTTDDQDNPQNWSSKKKGVVVLQI